MKRLKVKGLTRLLEGESSYQCDEIVLELDHGRTMTIQRSTFSGEDGVTLIAGIDREDRTANARFVIRAGFSQVHLSIEQAK